MTSSHFQPHSSQKFRLPSARQDAHRFAEGVRHQEPYILEQQSGSVQPALPVVSELIRFLKNLVCANPEEFYGKNYVTDELIEHSQLTARSISIASIVNAITNQPLLFFAFRDFSNPVAWGFSLTLNLLIVKFTNDMGTSVAGRKQNNHIWATAGAIGLISMSTLQSVVAAVGSEAMLNGQQLSARKAAELIEERSENLERFEPSQLYANTEAERDRVAAQLAALNKDDPRWDSVYLHLHGAYEERGRDWCSLPVEQQPLNPRLDCLREEEFRIQKQASETWQQKLASGQELGDLAFLKQELPEVFQQHYEADYTLKSGIETVRLAAINLNHKVRHFDLAGLGFPLFFLCLSLFTSTAACLMTFGHAVREDTKMSRDEEVGKAIQAYLSDLAAHADDSPLPSDG